MKTENGYEYEVRDGDSSVEINTNDDRFIYLTLHDLEELINALDEGSELIL